MFKKLLIAGLSLWLSIAQAGYTDPLVITEDSGNRTLEPSTTATVTYHVTSNVRTQSVRFSISQASGAVLLNEGFTCGNRTSPAVGSQQTCRFKIRYVAPTTPGTFAPQLSLFTEGSDRGGSNGAEVTHTTTFTIDSPGALTLSSNRPPFLESVAGDADGTIVYTITNNGTDDLTGITFTDTFDPNNILVISYNTDNCDDGAPAGEGGAFGLDAGDTCEVSYDYTTPLATVDYDFDTVTINVEHPGGFFATTSTTVMAVPRRTTWADVDVGNLNSNFGLVDAYADTSGANQNHLYLLIDYVIYRTTDTTAIELSQFANPVSSDFYPTKLDGVGTQLYAAGSTLSGPFEEISTPEIWEKADITDNTAFTAFDFGFDASSFLVGYITNFATADAGGDEMIIGWANLDGFSILYRDTDIDLTAFFESSFYGFVPDVVAFAIDREETDRKAFAALYDRIVVSIENNAAGISMGEFWSTTRTSPALRFNEYITSLAVLNMIDGGGGETAVYVGTNRALYRSDDSGDTWVELAAGVSIESLAVTRGDGNDALDTDHYLYVGTRGEGIYRCDDANNEIQCVQANLDAAYNEAIPLTDNVLKIVNSGEYPSNVIYAITSTQANPNAINVYRGTNPA